MLKSVINNTKHPNPFNPFFVFLYLLQGRRRSLVLSAQWFEFISSILLVSHFLLGLRHLATFIIIGAFRLGMISASLFDLGDSLEQRPREGGGRTISAFSNLQPPTSTPTKFSPMPYTMQVCQHKLHNKSHTFLNTLLRKIPQVFEPATPRRVSCYLRFPYYFPMVSPLQQPGWRFSSCIVSWRLCASAPIYITSGEFSVLPYLFPNLLCYSASS